MNTVQTGRAVFCPLLASVCIALLLLHPIASRGQDSIQRYVGVVDEKITAFNGSVDKYTLRTLDKLISQERKMQRKVAARDSGMARKFFDYSIDSLGKFKSMIQSGSGSLSHAGQRYFSYLDTLKQSLSFLNKGDALGNVTALENRLAVADKLNEFLQQRQQVLQSVLKSFPDMGGGIASLKKEAFYYKGQVEEYKNTLKDPDKIERAVVGALGKTAAFQHFMEQHSQLAGLFASPAAFGAPGGSVAGVNGLASRSAVQQMLQANLPGSGPSVAELVKQQTESASGAVEPDKLKDLLNKTSGSVGGAAPNADANTLHTLPFRRRLEFSTDVQFGKSTNYLPATTDFAVMGGYKLSGRSSLGVGLTYKLGVGNGWSKIRLSNEGLGFRAYLKVKLKSNFFLQGSGEWNYLTAFESISQLHDANAWQTSALLSLGKSYHIRKKLSGNIQLAYDLLYRQHQPISQPVLFRLGYNFN